MHQNNALLSQATITRSSPPIAAHIQQVTNSEIVKTKSYTKWNMVPKTGKVKVKFGYQFVAIQLVRKTISDLVFLAHSSYINDVHHLIKLLYDIETNVFYEHLNLEKKSSKILKM